MQNAVTTAKSYRNVSLPGNERPASRGKQMLSLNWKALARQKLDVVAAADALQ